MSVPRKQVVKARKQLKAQLQAEERKTAQMHAKEEHSLALATSTYGGKAAISGSGKKAKKKKKGFKAVNFVPERGVIESTQNNSFLNSASCFVQQMPRLVRGAQGLRGPSGQMIKADTGAFRVQRIKTGHPWADCVFNGIPGSTDCRYPDPFTLVNTSVAVVSTTISEISLATSSTSSSTSYDYTVYGLFKGSPVKTYLQPDIGGTVTATGHMDWKAADGAWNNCGTAASQFLTRPNGCTLDIIPRFVGPVHTAKLYAIPILPLSSSQLTSTSVTGWPDSPNNGLSAVQVSWGGRERELDSTSKGVRLVSVPIDSRCLDFMAGGDERYGYGGGYQVGWTSWLFWFAGLGASDRVDLVFNFTEEMIPLTFGQATQFAYPATPKRADSRLRDTGVNTVKALTDSGVNAYSWVDTAIDLAKKAWGIGSKIIGAFSAGAMLMAPAPAGPEEKVDEGAPRLCNTPPLFRKDSIGDWIDDSSTSSSASSSVHKVPVSTGQRR